MIRLHYKMFIAREGMMRYAKHILVLLLCITFVGCTNIVTKEPIGHVIDLKEGKLEDGTKFNWTDLEGTWNGGDNIIFSKILKDGKTIKVAYLQWSGEEFEMLSDDIVFSELGGNVYINQKMNNDEGYCIASLGHSFIENDDLIDILVFYPDEEEFKTAINDKKLLGEVGSDIYLKSTKEDIDVFIGNNHKKLFNFGVPKVYRKIPWVKYD